MATPLPPASRTRQRRGLALYQDMTAASSAAWLPDGRLVVCRLAWRLHPRRGVCFAELARV